MLLVKHSYVGARLESIIIHEGYLPTPAAACMKQSKAFSSSPLPRKLSPSRNSREYQEEETYALTCVTNSCVCVCVCV